MVETVYRGNSHVFTLWNTRDSNGAYLNSKTVTSEVRTVTGAPLSTPVQPSFAYVAASDGTYEGTMTVAHTNLLTPDEDYRLWVEFNGGTNKVAHLEVKFKVAIRER